MLGPAEFCVKVCFCPFQNNGHSLMVICSNHHGNELVSNPHHRPDWKNVRHTVKLKISRLLWNLYVYISSPLDPLMVQLNAVGTI